METVWAGSGADAAELALLAAGAAAAMSAGAEDASQLADAGEAADLRAARGGDDGAYERLVRRHQQAVARQMWRFTRDRDTLEELVHDAFVEAWLSLAKYRGDAPFAHWLARIATRVGYAYWKRLEREKARRSVPLEGWDGSERSEPSRQVDLADLARTLLAELPPRDRLVLTLLYIEGRETAEAAELAGWSRTMVKVQAFRARKKFRALLEARLPHAEDLSWMR